jgi:hypothetical protein
MSCHQAHSDIFLDINVAQGDIDVYGCTIEISKKNRPGLLELVGKSGGM